jgi:hypothetical protein
MDRLRIPLRVGMAVVARARASTHLRPLLARGDPRRWGVLTQRGRLALAALIVLGCALLLRVGLILFPWPPTDSDEATMGLMALHIDGSGERPIFFYGQQYMGTLEAYLAAGAFHLFGPSLLALRLGTLLMSVGALAVLYLLARRLYSPGLSLLCLGLLALGPAEALLRELWSGGGYAETLLFGSTVMLLGTWLAQTTPPANATRAPVGRPLLRLGAFAGWGVAAGLGLWSDFLVLPFVLASGLLLAACCWRAWRVALPAAVAGLLVGGFPLLAYALTAPSHDPFVGALGVSQSSDAWRGDVFAQVVGQLGGTIAVALPNITGGDAICSLSPSDQWPLASATPHDLACTGVHALWGLGFMSLLTVALILPARTLWLGRRHNHSHDAFVRDAARLALAGAAALGLLLFLASPVAARSPQLHARYLIAVLIALPAVLAPVWSVATRPRLPVPSAPPHAWIARLALGVVAAAYLLAFGSVLVAIPAAQAQNQQRGALVAHLERAGASRVFSEYWTCGWLIFFSRERLVCAALDPHLQPDLVDRYPPYRAQVEAAPDAAYVFPLDSAQAAAFAARVDGSAVDVRYVRETYAGYVIYRPLPTH